eukprot:TRINITY_DN64019_c0_g1_i2.p1 TRINITY_DN64019_c0_g1~~TRINITY_DN64019_c0_g1_i2.p1  ORF type:complete len:436 (+),score=66.19 TRINITY_DN64019_c0_g1_i2:65-1309(+)
MPRPNSLWPVNAELAGSTDGSVSKTSSLTATLAMPCFLRSCTASVSSTRQPRRSSHHRLKRLFCAGGRLLTAANALAFVSAETYEPEKPAVLNDFTSCSAHLRLHDWNDNGTVEQWQENYVGTVWCAREQARLARQAGKRRPAAQSGVHVPTVIVPTESSDLPDLPPFYFVLPVYDMVVSNRVRLFGSYDAQELDILMRLTKPGGAFVDIGANIGSVTVPMGAHLGREGVVYSFEPFRQVFQFLNANVATNGLANVYTYQAALSDEAAGAPTELEVPAPTLENAQNAGMYAVFQAETTMVNERTSETRERMEMITVRTLDSFRLPRADVIKIDVEGHAPRVLAGAVETIKRFRPVLWFEEGGSLPEVLLDPALQYWCTKFHGEHITTEDQFICVPREKHADVQEALHAEPPEKK